MEKVKSPPSEKVEALFLSVLSRRPTMNEKDIAKRAIFPAVMTAMPT
jgi:hypothetical protein